MEVDNIRSTVTPVNSYIASVVTNITGIGSDISAVST